MSAGAQAVCAELSQPRRWPRTGEALISLHNPCPSRSDRSEPPLLSVCLRCRDRQTLGSWYRESREYERIAPGPVAVAEGVHRQHRQVTRLESSGNLPLEARPDPPSRCVQRYSIFNAHGPPSLTSPPPPRLKPSSEFRQFDEEVSRTVAESDTWNLKGRRTTHAKRLDWAAMLTLTRASLRS